MNSYKPKIFLGSSLQSLPILRKAASCLQDHFQVYQWDNDVFENGEVTVNALMNKAHEFDYALMFFMPDDCLVLDGKKYNVTRDNVIFETGLFMRVLGKQRVAIVIADLVSEKGKKTKTRFLSDLSGITYLYRFSIRQDKYDPSIIGDKIDDDINRFCEDLKNKVGRDKNSLSIRMLKESYFQAQELLRRMVEKEELDFEIPILKWRIETEYEKYSDIRSGNWEIIADDNYPYMRLVFRKLMETLEEGDEYFTVTNYKFWSKGKYNVSEFFDQNKIAVEKGIAVKRVMLLDVKLLELEDIRQQLHEIIEKFIEKGIGKLITFRVYEAPPESDAFKHVPYAVIRRKKQSNGRTKDRYLTIMPTLSEDSSPRINVIFRQSSDVHQQCLNLFNDCNKPGVVMDCDKMTQYLKSFKKA